MAERRLFRIVGAAAGTKLTYEPNVPGAPAQIGFGEIAELTSDTPFIIKSQDDAHPFLFATYMSSSGDLVSRGAPAGYGYPSVQAGAYVLQAKDLSGLPLPNPAVQTSGYTATSQTYLRDTIAFGKTSYVRNAVLVPAHTTLTLTIATPNLAGEVVPAL